MVEILDMPFDELAEYERFFFEEIRMPDTGSRKDSSIPLPANEWIEITVFKVRKKISHYRKRRDWKMGQLDERSDSDD